jgi:hypothetical protein
MLGVGSGILVVPALTLIFQMPIQVAIGCSLIGIVMNSCTAAAEYIRYNMANLKIALMQAAIRVPGAILGGILAAILDKSILTVIFGTVMLYIAFTMIPRKPTIVAEEAKVNVAKDGPKPYDWLEDCYHDPATHLDFRYQAYRLWPGLGVGFFGGVISSLLGVGGGIITVPVMTRIMRVPIKPTIATAVLIMAVVTMTGSLVYIYNGYVNPYVAASIAAGVYIGGWLGAWASHRLQNYSLLIMFSIFLMLISIVMVLNAFKVLGG